ncbi:MAG: beta-galactosidase trimerization domain-containing protein, partial [Abditibacteriaceae bacterium]
MTNQLRFRQVHLDFHTGEKIPGVGSQFNAAQFQEMLQCGHVDSITVFSKCHHGLSYHDTKIGARHPGMDQQLLPLQLEACHAIDVKTPIYISAGFDEAALRAHPEWAAKAKDGSSFNPLRAGFKRLCFSTPYLDYLCAQIEEVVDRFGADHGIFLDIIRVWHCYCDWCLDGMTALGLDPQCDVDADNYAQIVQQKYFSRTTAAAQKGNANRRVFHNAGHIPKGAKHDFGWNSHLELESLPTGGWGYDHFPVSAKYAATTGYDFLGMTGKFHTSWGEFGGFKRPQALQYECAAMLAFGAKCSVGDQLHPSGLMNPDTYSLIGAAYSQVQENEPWCQGSRAVSEIALVSPEALHADNPLGHGQTSAEEGAARMLLELHHQFDVVDLDRDLAPYKLVILPDEIILQNAFLEKIQQYIKNGGKVLLSGNSGLTPDKSTFAIDTGLELVTRSEFDPDYIVPGDKMAGVPVRSSTVIHGGAWDVRPNEQCSVLASRMNPYFNRDWNHFCSHAHTPDDTASEFPAAVQCGGIVYFAHHIFTRYRLYGQPLYRDLVADAIARLLPQRSVETDLPSAARVSLMRQEEQNRYILHLLYATPTLRGGSNGDNAHAVEIIEDLVPLHDVHCKIRLQETVRSVCLAPSGEELNFTLNEG